MESKVKHCYKIPVSKEINRDEINEKPVEKTEEIDKTKCRDLDNKLDNSQDNDQDNNQHNHQDLDQEQDVEINPVQYNFQNIQLEIHNKIENYTGEIVGSIYSEEGKVLMNAHILLYFGSAGGLPVCRVESDQNGNFKLKDLPPGYYTLHAYFTEDQMSKIPNIRILPGQSIFQTIYVK